MKLQADLAGVLRKQRNQNFPLQNALLELIDNSVDEGATTILIRELDGDLIITDNGGGFSNIPSALIVGKSSKRDQIGRYGVGLKDACVRYSVATTIQSRGIQVCVPWQEIIDETSDGELQCDQIQDSDITRIILHNFRARYSKSIETQEMRRVYLPLIDDGLTIEVNGQVLEGLEQPDYVETIQESFDFQGRKVTITGGIYKADDPMRPVWKGYNPYYRGRLIGPGKITNHGTGDEGCTNFCFMLTLEDAAESWTLATNKDAVEDLHDLLEYCYNRYTREMLERGAEASRDIELKEVEESVNRALSGGGNITRSRSTKPKPSVKPTDTGTKKTRTNTANGKGRYIGNGSRSRLLFQFAHIGGESLGEIQNQGKRIIITANLDNPFISENKTNEPLILCMAKFAFAMQSQISKCDMLADEYVTGIMNQAGEELVLSAES